MLEKNSETKESTLLFALDDGEVIRVSFAREDLTSVMDMAISAPLAGVIGLKDMTKSDRLGVMDLKDVTEQDVNDCLGLHVSPEVRQLIHKKVRAQIAGMQEAA